MRRSSGCRIIPPFVVERQVHRVQVIDGCYTRPGPYQRLPDFRFTPGRMHIRQGFGPGRCACAFQTPAGAHDHTAHPGGVPVQPGCEFADRLSFPRHGQFPGRQRVNLLRRQACPVPFPQRGDGFRHDAGDQGVVQAAQEHAAQGRDKSHQYECGQRQRQQYGAGAGSAYHVFTRDASALLHPQMTHPCLKHAGAWISADVFMCFLFC